MVRNLMGLYFIKNASLWVFLSAATLGCSASEKVLGFLGGPSLTTLSVTYAITNEIILKSTVVTTTITPTVTGSPTLFAIAPALPAGLTFDTTNGDISGAPTVTTPQTYYTVTASNNDEIATDTFNLRTADGWQVTDTTDLSDTSPGDGNCLAANTECTLRAAIEESNTNGPGSKDVILIPGGTYTLNGTASLDITTSMELIGNSKNSVAIDGNATGAANSSQRIFNVSSGLSIDVSIKQMTLTNAKPPNGQGGAGIYVATNGGFIEISDIKITASEVSGGAGVGGGGIMIDGSVADTDFNINLCELSNNKSVGTASGGGLFIYANSDTATIDNCRFFSNEAEGAGGGVAIADSLNITISRSLFESNHAIANGGGLDYNNATDNNTLVNSTFYDNSSSSNGGGAFMNSAGFSNHTVTNCTFVSNIANSACA